MSADHKNRLIAVTLDEGSIGRGNPDQEHERQIAIYDLVEVNHFAVASEDQGPYALHVSLHENKLLLDVRAQNGAPIVAHLLSLSPFRRILKDYFMVCESYYAAIRGSSPTRIEAIDMGRRGIHDEGATLLAERLKDKIVCDFDTARRMFTLVTALHWKG